MALAGPSRYKSILVILFQFCALDSCIVPLFVLVLFYRKTQLCISPSTVGSLAHSTYSLAMWDLLFDSFVSGLCATNSSWSHQIQNSIICLPHHCLSLTVYHGEIHLFSFARPPPLPLAFDQYILFTLDSSRLLCLPVWLFSGIWCWQCPECIRHRLVEAA